MLYYVPWYCIILYDITSNHITLHYMAFTSCDIIFYNFISYRIISYHTISRHVILYLIVSYCTISYSHLIWQNRLVSVIFFFGIFKRILSIVIATTELISGNSVKKQFYQKTLASLPCLLQNKKVDLYNLTFFFFLLFIVGNDWSWILYFCCCRFFWLWVPDNFPGVRYLRLIKWWGTFFRILPIDYIHPDLNS